MTWKECPQKKSNLTLYLIILLLLICSRFFDLYTTYLATPDLTKESNLMVIYLGLGWFKLIFMNILIIVIFFLLFRFSWPRLTRRGQDKLKANNPTFKEKKKLTKHRNISHEIGITLPIYVIITGYFQGIVNIMIHLNLIIVSFSILLYLYPIIIGGIFGYISLYLSKKFLYLGHPWFPKKAHKIMMPRITVENEAETQSPQSPVETSFLSPAQSLYSHQ